jgi:hypothetical protein
VLDHHVAQQFKARDLVRLGVERAGTKRLVKAKPVDVNVTSLSDYLAGKADASGGASMAVPEIDDEARDDQA